MVVLILVMSSGTVPLFSDHTVLRTDVGLEVSVTVVAPEPFQVTVTVRGFWSPAEEVGQVLVARKHTFKRSGSSHQ